MKSFCVIGMDRFGVELALNLAKDKHQVMIIDQDADAVNELADYVTAAIIGDPKDEQVLRRAGVNAYDCAVVCSAGEIDDSIFITLLLKDMGVATVVSRAQSDLHGRILKKVGADRIVYPEKDMGERLANILGRRNVTDYFALSEDCTIIEIDVPATWVGKSMAALAIRREYAVNVIAVVSPDGVMDVSPDPKQPFAPGSQVILVGSKKNLDKI